ncbi:uncharacterized protein LOC130548463 isoform X5 [Triplophysa rosa]|uniref:uncharacterized protein LOC130548463 isoform X5 n=1 Tax=Triplophysa rosa TaxID=992332 RepID=UPI00254605AD|nr:uncharacterized protein LOC130548463 isoform X5 [Triplophysa rosa]
MLLVQSARKESHGYHISNEDCVTIRYEGVTLVGVFGDETERVTVNDGGSVTLHTNLTELQSKDVIMWRFKGRRIAKINREFRSDPVYDHDVRFTDRLKMNPQTGDLTITNITSELTGHYQLVIDRKKPITKSFSVSLSPEVKIVKERDSVTLHIDVTDEQRNDQIHWKIKHNKSPVAEIITVNGTISTHLIEERFRDRLKLDDQTGSLTITHMKNEDSGPYEADVTIGSITHTIHKTFSVTDSGLSPGVIAGICVSLLLLVIAAVVGVVIYRRRKMRHEGCRFDPQGRRVTTEVSLSKAPYPYLLPGRCSDSCPLLRGYVWSLLSGWVKCRGHISGSKTLKMDHLRR